MPSQTYFAYSIRTFGLHIVAYVHSSPVPGTSVIRTLVRDRQIDTSLVPGEIPEIGWSAGRGGEEVSLPRSQLTSRSSTAAIGSRAPPDAWFLEGGC